MSINTGPILSPCKGCGKRHQACHDTCQEFADFRKELEKVRKAERDANVAYHIYYTGKPRKKGRS